MPAANRQDLKARAFELSSTLLDGFTRLAAGGPQFTHMARQLFESGTAIGAMLEEAEVFLSRRDLAAKYVVALREARECRYWLRLFAKCPDRIALIQPLLQESHEFIAILTASVKRLRSESDP